MASIVHEPSYNRRESDRYPATAPLRAEGIRVSWGSIFGGVLLALGLLILLTALGAAIGITAAEPGETDAGTAGRAAGIYGAVSLLVALFFGGWAATRIGAITDRATGFAEGALVWVVAIVLTAGLATIGLGNLMGGALSMAGSASEAAGSAMQSQGGNASGGSSGQMIDQAKDKVGQLMDRAKGVDLEQKAAEAKPAAQRGAWITFGALVLSLITAVIGAMTGRRDPIVKA